MPKYQITEQKVAWGWKDRDDIGDLWVSDILEYDSMLDLLAGEEFTDNDYDEDTQGEFDRMLVHLDKNPIMFGTEDRIYVPNPQPCDSYLTYFFRFTIKEVSPSDLAKMDAERTLILTKKKAENRAKWDAFFKEHNGSNGEILDTLYNDYEFPSEIK